MRACLIIINFWKFTFPVVPPIYEVVDTLFLKHIFDLIKLFNNPVNLISPPVVLAKTVFGLNNFNN